MNVQHLHDLRGGKSIQRRLRFNPFAHIATNTPLMQMLFNITRPPQDKPPFRNAFVPTAKKNVGATTTQPGGSMVAYKKERRKF